MVKDPANVPGAPSVERVTEKRARAEKSERDRSFGGDGLEL
jgi:hypothetical protein